MIVYFFSSFCLSFFLNFLPWLLVGKFLLCCFVIIETLYSNRYGSVITRMVFNIFFSVFFFFGFFSYTTLLPLKIFFFFLIFFYRSQIPGHVQCWGDLCRQLKQLLPKSVTFKKDFVKLSTHYHHKKKKNLYIYISFHPHLSKSLWEVCRSPKTS